jgi:type I restriction enzyme R subunit
MSSAFTEDSLVQQTTAEHLEKDIGWESVYADNQEPLGPSPQGMQ